MHGRSALFGPGFGRIARLALHVAEGVDLLSDLIAMGSRHVEFFKQACGDVTATGDVPPMGAHHVDGASRGQFNGFTSVGR